MDFRKSTDLGQGYTFSTLASRRIMAGQAPERDREHCIGDQIQAWNVGIMADDAFECRRRHINPAKGNDLSKIRKP